MTSSREKNDSWITSTPSGGERVASLTFSKSSELSKVTLEKSEPGYAWELMQLCNMRETDLYLAKGGCDGTKFSSF